MTINVPIRVGSKLRPEHMVISDECDDDTIILGTPWLKRYGVTLRLKDATIHIPTRSGVDVIVQGVDVAKSSKVVSQPNEVYAIKVRVEAEGRDLGDTKNELRDVGYGEQLLDYCEEIYNSDDDLTSGDDDDYSMTEDEAKKLEALLEEYKICFVEFSGIGRVDEERFSHRIDLIDENKNVRTKPYRLTWEEDEFLKEQIQDLLNKGILRPSKGRWTSPVFFVSKRGGVKDAIGG